MQLPTLKQAKCICVAVLTIFSIALAPQSIAGTRYVPMVLSISDQDSADSVFGYMRLLQQQMPNVLPRLNSGDLQLGRKTLTVVFQRVNVPSPPPDLAIYWIPDQTLFVASVVPVMNSEDNRTTIENQVWLRDMKGPFADEYIYFHQHLDPLEFEIDRDVMAFVTLYTHAVLRANELAPGTNPKPICDAVGRAITVGQSIQRQLLDKRGVKMRNNLLDALADLGRSNCI